MQHIEQKNPIIEIPPDSTTSMKSLMNTEVLLAAVLPVVALCLITWYAATNVRTESALWLIVLFVVVSIAIFAVEVLLILVLHKMMRQRFMHLITVCQEFASGHHHVRAAIDEDSETRPVARAVNALLDHLAIKLEAAPAQAAPRYQSGFLTPPPPVMTPILDTPSYAPPQITAVPSEPMNEELQKELNAVRNDLLLADRQIKQLIHEMNPVLDGDLRQKASPIRGHVGVMAEICNYLIEEIVSLARWTRYATEQVVDNSQSLLDRAVKLARTTESQMQHLTQTTEVIEKTVAFAQRLGSSIQLSIDIAQDIQKQVHTSSLLPQVEPDLQRQVELLGEMLASSQRQSDDAEGTLTRLYTFARQTHEASLAILTTAERISTLATLAEQWRGSVDTLELPPEEADPAPVEETRALPPGRK